MIVSTSILKQALSLIPRSVERVQFVTHQSNLYLCWSLPGEQYQLNLEVDTGKADLNIVIYTKRLRLAVAGLPKNARYFRLEAGPEVLSIGHETREFFIHSSAPAEDFSPLAITGDEWINADFDPARIRESLYAINPKEHRNQLRFFCFRGGYGHATDGKNAVRFPSEIAEPGEPDFLIPYAAARIFSVTGVARCTWSEDQFRFSNGTLSACIDKAPKGTYPDIGKYWPNDFSCFFGVTPEFRAAVKTAANIKPHSGRLSLVISGSEIALALKDECGHQLYTDRIPCNVGMLPGYSIIAPFDPALLHQALKNAVSISISAPNEYGVRTAVLQTATGNTERLLYGMNP